MNPGARGKPAGELAKDIALAEKLGNGGRKHQEGEAKITGITPA